MALLNYTTTVSVSRTIAEVQNLLVAGGARQVMTQYDDDGLAQALAFACSTRHGVRTFVLPVNTAAVEVALRRDGVPRRYQGPEHAARVAWRIVKDWVEAQLAIVRTDMVTLDQVMLPYMRVADDRTVYDLYLDQQLALPTGDR